MTAFNFTSAGVAALVNPANTGTAAVVITSVALGDGTRAPTGAEEALVNETHRASFAGDDGAADNQIVGSALFDNTAGAAAIAATEIGIFARIGGGAEFLLAYWSTAAGTVGQTIAAWQYGRTVVGIEFASAPQAEISFELPTAVSVGGAAAATLAETVALTATDKGVPPAFLGEGIDAAFAQDSRSGILLPRHFAKWRDDSFVRQIFAAGFSLTPAGANNAPQAAVGSFRSSGNLTRGVAGEIIQPEGAVSWFGCDARDLPPIGGAFVATMKVENYHAGGILIALVDSAQTATSGSSINPNLFFDSNHRLHFTSGGHDSSAPQHVFINTPINPNRRVEIFVMGIRHSDAEWRIRFAWRQGDTFHQSAVIGGYTPAQMGDMRLVRFGADPFDTTVGHSNAGGRCIDAINGVLPTHLSTLEELSIEDFYVGDLRAAQQRHNSPVGSRRIGLYGAADGFETFYPQELLYPGLLSYDRERRRNGFYYFLFGNDRYAAGEYFEISLEGGRPANADSSDGVNDHWNGHLDKSYFRLSGKFLVSFDIILSEVNLGEIGHGLSCAIFSVEDGKDDVLYPATESNQHASGLAGFPGDGDLTRYIPARKERAYFVFNLDKIYYLGIRNYGVDWYGSTSHPIAPNMNAEIFFEKLGD